MVRRRSASTATGVVVSYGAAQVALSTPADGPVVIAFAGTMALFAVLAVIWLAVGCRAVLVACAAIAGAELVYWLAGGGQVAAWGAVFLLGLTGFAWSRVRRSP
jgi:hypothetical protein